MGDKVGALLENYSGREQSFIKHAFLTDYLKSAAFKILQAGYNSFVFVDAFAGPWSTSTENHSDSSFNQALDTLHQVKCSLPSPRAENLNIRLCLCEKNPSRVEKLKAFAKTKSNFDIRVFQGNFEDNLESISRQCSDGFTFTFIDPTGWNINSSPVFDFLRETKGEFLINFMSEHINRHASYEKVSQSFGRFLADPDWSQEFAQLPNNLSNEEKVLYLLKKKIKSENLAKYMPDFPILKVGENRIKMRLLLGTQSAKGLEVFRNVQYKAERQQIETRYNIDQDRDLQVSLFSADQISSMVQGSTGVGSKSHLDQASVITINLIKERGAVRFREIWPRVLEDIPIRLQQLKELVGTLNKTGILKYDLPPRKRTLQEDTLIKLN